MSKLYITQPPTPPSKGDKRLTRAGGYIGEGIVAEKTEPPKPPILYEPDIWVLSFRGEGQGPPTSIRVRRLLKAALRSYGLRCIDHAGKMLPSGDAGGRLGDKTSHESSEHQKGRYGAG